MDRLEAWNLSAILEKFTVTDKSIYVYVLCIMQSKVKLIRKLALILYKNANKRMHFILILNNFLCKLCHYYPFSNKEILQSSFTLHDVSH